MPLISLSNKTGNATNQMNGSTYRKPRLTVVEMKGLDFRDLHRARYHFLKLRIESSDPQECACLGDDKDLEKKSLNLAKANITYFPHIHTYT